MNDIIINDIKFIKDKHKIKIVVYTEEMLFDVNICLNNKIYSEGFNDKEPFDRLNHYFHVPAVEVENTNELILSGKDISGDKVEQAIKFNFSVESRKTELKRNNNKLKIIKETDKKIIDGFKYSYFELTDKNNLPVKAFVYKIDYKKCSIHVGTPNDDYKCGNVKSTIPEMAEAAIKNGANIIAAVNADFFDIYGDASPSGLCIKNGITIANENSKRPFIYTDINDYPGISTRKELKNNLSSILNAVSGLQLIVNNGKLYEWGPLEPFCYVRHPRTAVGIDKSKNIIICVIDGRLDEYSNGATLVDLGYFMIKLGAVKAINMDGGGSSCVYIMENGCLTLKNRPADLFRPRDMLIREEYNCILISRK